MIDIKVTTGVNARKQPVVSSCMKSMQFSTTISTIHGGFGLADSQWRTEQPTCCGAARAPNRRPAAYPSRQGRLSTPPVNSDKAQPADLSSRRSATVTRKRDGLRLPCADVEEGQRGSVGTLSPAGHPWLGFRRDLLKPRAQPPLHALRAMLKSTRKRPGHQLEPQRGVLPESSAARPPRTALSTARAA